MESTMTHSELIPCFRKRSARKKYGCRFQWYITFHVCFNPRNHYNHHVKLICSLSKHLWRKPVETCCCACSTIWWIFIHPQAWIGGNAASRPHSQPGIWRSVYHTDIHCFEGNIPECLSRGSRESLRCYISQYRRRSRDSKTSGQTFLLVYFSRSNEKSVILHFTVLSLKNWSLYSGDSSRSQKRHK